MTCKQPLWSTLAHGKSIQQAVAEFAAEYWAEPRRAGKVRDGRFKLRDGVCEYEISEDNGLYHVARIDQD
jgi:hypothetical protein